eukprot:11072824-Prorocentrum_lima.AAC.1
MPLDHPQSCEERRAHPCTTPTMLREREGGGRGGDGWRMGRRMGALVGREERRNWEGHPRGIVWVSGMWMVELSVPSPR